MVFTTLDPHTLNAIAQLGRRKQFAKGAHVFSRGDAGASLLIIETGRAEVSITTALGQKSILGLVGQGDVVGDIACLDGGPRSADVVALEPVTGLEVMRRDVLELLRQDSNSAIVVIEALCQKARNASEMLELKALASGQARLAGCILRLLADANGNTGGNTGGDRVQVSQSWLGHYAGLTRENVNRQLKSWADDGIARFEKGAVIVTNRQVLEDLVLHDGGA